MTEILNEFTNINPKAEVPVAPDDQPYILTDPFEHQVHQVIVTKTDKPSPAKPINHPEKEPQPDILPDSSKQHQVVNNQTPSLITAAASQNLQALGVPNTDTSHQAQSTETKEQSEAGEFHDKSSTPKSSEIVHTEEPPHQPEPVKPKDALAEIVPPPAPHPVADSSNQRSGGGGRGGGGSGLLATIGAGVARGARNLYNEITPAGQLRNDLEKHFLTEARQDQRAKIANDIAQRQKYNASLLLNEAGKYMDKAAISHQVYADNTREMNTAISKTPEGEAFIRAIEKDVQTEARTSGTIPSAAREAIWDKIHGNDTSNPRINGLRNVAEHLSNIPEVKASMTAAQDAAMDFKGANYAAMDKFKQGIAMTPDGSAKNGIIDAMKQRQQRQQDLMSADTPDGILSKPGTEKSKRLENMKEQMQEMFEKMMEQIRAMVDKILNVLLGKNSP